MNYDEQFFLTQVGPALAADYLEAKRHVGDDAQWVVWPARVDRDASDGGLTYPESLTKHRKEWRAALGLIDPFPKPPTRDEVCGVQLTFQGLNVFTAQYGLLPWFEPALVGLSTIDRMEVYAAKQAARDKHIIIEFTKGGSVYDEPGQPFQQIISPDFEANPGLFLGFVEEIIVNGFIPIIAFDGDDGDNVEHGYPNALRQLPILVKLLASSLHGDLNQYVLYARLWDGVFYGSSPANIINFGVEFRKLLPNGYLGIEHQPGRIPVGGGPADWGNGGGMQNYDVLFDEFNDANIHTDSTWQVAGRLLGPAYHRPADQPSGDDPNPPWYMRDGTPRGPYFPIAFEYAEYEWVRSLFGLVQIDQMRTYLGSLGYKYVS